MDKNKSRIQEKKELCKEVCKWAKLITEATNHRPIKIVCEDGENKQ